MNRTHSISTTPDHGRRSSPPSSLGYAGVALVSPGQEATSSDLGRDCQAGVSESFGKSVHADAAGRVARLSDIIAQRWAISRQLSVLAGNGSSIAAPSGLSLSEGRPLLTVRSVAGGHPEIVWKKGRYDALEIEVDRDGQGFHFLSIDTVPDYTDTHALPATPALWKYRAIYRLRDERIGQWSDTAQITVHS